MVYCCQITVKVVWGIQTQIGLEMLMIESQHPDTFSKDLQNGPTGPTVIHEDNQSAICMAENPPPPFHGRTKHIEIKYHFVREKVWMELFSSNTAKLIADIINQRT